MALLHLRGAQERTVAGGAGLLRAEDLGLPAEDHPAMLHLLQVGKLKCEVWIVVSPHIQKRMSYIYLLMLEFLDILQTLNTQIYNLTLIN